MTTTAGGNATAAWRVVDAHSSEFGTPDKDMQQVQACVVRRAHGVDEDVFVRCVCVWGGAVRRRAIALWLQLGVW